MKRRAILALLSSVCAAGAAWGAEHEAESLTSTLWLPLVNFAGFVFLFYWFAWPAITSALTDRRRLVVKELSEADEAHRGAAALLAEVESRRARLKEEGERLVGQLRAEAEADRARLVAAARQSAERIRSDARLLAGQEAARAAQRIREEIAEQVIARAVAMLRDRLTSEDQDRFVGEFAAAVEAGELS